jgi:hypothetical protein
MISAAPMPARQSGDVWIVVDLVLAIRHRTGRVRPANRGRRHTAATRVTNRRPWSP